MDECRTLLGFSFFLVGCYFFYLLFASGFSFPVLGGSLACFILGDLLIPSERRRREGGWELIDLVEYLVHIPYWFGSTLIRFLGRLLSSKSFDI